MDARFVSSTPDTGSLPAPSLPELAVAGRSNCGKSSLINALTGRTRLARTSSTPGRTQELVFFQVQLTAGGQPFMLVDLPGYGYARVSKATKSAWGGLVDFYIQTRPTLRALLLLMDIRRKPEAEEQDLLRWADERGVPIQLVLTKADKLQKNQRFGAAQAVKRTLHLARRPLVVSVRDPEAVEALRELVSGQMMDQGS